jgi:hypothetical protein
MYLNQKNAEDAINNQSDTLVDYETIKESRKESEVLVMMA